MNAPFHVWRGEKLVGPYKDVNSCMKRRLIEEDELISFDNGATWKLVSECLSPAREAEVTAPLVATSYVVATKEPPRPVQVVVHGEKTERPLVRKPQLPQPAKFPPLPTVSYSDEESGPGLFIAGFACLTVGILFQLLSLVFFVIYLPLYFGAFCCAITAIGRRQVLGSILLIAAILTIPLITGGAQLGISFLVTTQPVTLPPSRNSPPGSR